MNVSLWSDWAQLNLSTRAALVAELVCLAGLLLSVVAGIRHIRRRATAPGSPGGAWELQVFAALAGAGVLAFALWRRWIEVNHFPSQTMSEVLTVFTTCLLLSVLVLHFVLGLYRKGPGWTLLDDGLHVLVFAGALATLHYVESQSTAQRDLPPALQSYWFAPHILALVMSYALLGVAGLICLFYFVTRFWSGVLHGGQSGRSQLGIAALLTLVPFAHFVTAPALWILPPLFLGLAWLYHLAIRRPMPKLELPHGPRLRSLERDLDDVSFRAFAVGIPFLTAGLWMGSFWAQEAWANYWGWDSKENSALISWLIYVVYMHLRLLGGYRGAKAMGVLMSGALSVFITFQLFGYLPDSQKSLHRYTDENVTPAEGQMGPQGEGTTLRWVLPDDACEELASLTPGVTSPRGAAQ